jgi:hypothetical protein
MTPQAEQMYLSSNQQNIKVPQFCRFPLNIGGANYNQFDQALQGTAIYLGSQISSANSAGAAGTIAPANSPLLNVSLYNSKIQHHHELQYLIWKLLYQQNLITA